MANPRRFPLVVRVFLAADLLLVLAFVLDHLLGNPFDWVTDFVDLDREGSLPTWFSSVQLFCAAVLHGLFAWSVLGEKRLGPRAPAVLALVLLAFSLDEVAAIHEWVGTKSDVLLPGSDRSATFFRHTGIWMFVVGIPFVLGFCALLRALRPTLRIAPAAFGLLAGGMALLLGGALGIEILSNLYHRDSLLYELQVLCEESCEMLGGTLLLASGLALCRARGIGLRMEPAAADEEEDGVTPAPRPDASAVTPEVPSPKRAASQSTR